MDSGALALAPVIFGVALGASALTFLVFWAYDQRRDARRLPFAVAAAGIGAIAYGVYVYGGLIAPRILSITERTIAAPGWNGPPVRIAVIAAPHLGPAGLSSQDLLRLIARINRAEPDLVVVVGDLTDPALAFAAMEERFQVTLSIGSLARLDAPLGVVAVLGPADAQFDREGVSRDLEDAGVAVLWNRSVVVDRVGAPFVLAGWAPGDQAEPMLASEGGPDGAPIVAVASGQARDLPLHGAAIAIIANADCARRFACARVSARVSASGSGGRENGEAIETAGLQGGGLTPPQILILTLQAADPS